MDCIFCKIVAGEIPSYKLYEDDDLIAFLDINPNSVGHTLIVPKKHTKDLETIDEELLLKVIDTSKKISKLLKDKLNIAGYAVATNCGICQDVKHFHMHIIPKYNKKINLSVEESYKKITE